MQLIYVVGVLAVGVIVSMQPAINAQVAGKLGSAMVAAICSIAISLMLVVAAWGVIGRFEMQWSRAASLPWWVLVSGTAGAVFVLGGILAAPRIGVAMFFICIVLGQLIGAAVADQIGAFGLEPQPISWLRATGILFVIAGAALTQADKWMGS
jgi:transporter family-2 protein